MSGYSEEFITNKLKEALEADHVEVVDQGNSYFYCIQHEYLSWQNNIE